MVPFIRDCPPAQGAIKVFQDHILQIVIHHPSIQDLFNGGGGAKTLFFSRTKTCPGKSWVKNIELGLPVAKPRKILRS